MVNLTTVRPQHHDFCPRILTVMWRNWKRFFKDSGQNVCQTELYNLEHVASLHGVVTDRAKVAVKVLRICELLPLFLSQLRHPGQILYIIQHGQITEERRLKSLSRN